MKTFKYVIAWIFIILLSPVMLAGAISGILFFAFILSLKATARFLQDWSDSI